MKILRVSIFQIFSKRIKQVLPVIGLFFLCGCKKLVEVVVPATSTSADIVYGSDNTATSVINGVYGRMVMQNRDISSFQGLMGLPVFSGLLSDELNLIDQANITLKPYFQNALSPGTLNVTTSSTPFDWTNIYAPVIYITNAIIQGVTSSKSLTPTIKMQLLGEARFMRAYCYMHLVSLYGDVPLAIGTDFKVNTILPRSPKSKVFETIINDLIEAESLLTANYPGLDMISASEERVRPNRYAAKALLARAYLYFGDYVNAEIKAGEVIANSNQYELVSLNDVFLKNSKETIWSLLPTGIPASNTANTGEGNLFIIPSTGPNSVYPVCLSDALVNSFEANDQRKLSWVNFSGIYPYAFKYKVGKANVPGSATVENIIMMRLGEQFLIRAEARARQNKLIGDLGAEADLNIIRNRAGLEPTTETTTQADMLLAILHERRVELFSEWGHRWFDLRRFEQLDQVMGSYAPFKGGVWSSFKALYPIPFNEVEFNPNIKGNQNSGY